MAQLHVLKDTDAAEWALRVDLAATFRLSAREKWNEGIGNHNSAMIPNTEYMLINPRGMIFHEIRASDLLVCDLKGNVVSGKGEVEPGASVPGAGPGKKPGMMGGHGGHEGHGDMEMGKPKEGGKPAAGHDHKP